MLKNQKAKIDVMSKEELQSILIDDDLYDSEIVEYVKNRLRQFQAGYKKYQSYQTQETVGKSKPSFSSSYKAFFKNYAVFTGRSSRSEYWFVVLANFLIILTGYILVIPAMINSVFSDSAAFMTVITIISIIAMAIYELICFIPNLSLGIRRLHDIGKSGWSLLVGLIPIVGAVILFVYSLTDSEPIENKYGQNPKEYPDKIHSNKNNTVLIVIIACLIISLILSGVYAVYGINNTTDFTDDYDNYYSDEDTYTDDDFVSEYNENNVKTNSQEIEDKINRYIELNANQNDVGIAIIDNISGRTYSSAKGESVYTAWGLYVPIYYAYTDIIGFNNTARNIMSSDIGTCNNAANNAINELGGLEAVNSYLSENFSAYSTHYGRFFADVNATDDNYTTACDAVKFLSKLAADGNEQLLSNHINDFDITAPTNSVVYAQVGSENRSIRNNLNLFAIINGNNSDYSVAIMTKNSQGSIISSLLSIIHNEMERVSE